MLAKDIQEVALACPSTPSATDASSNLQISDRSRHIKHCASADSIVEAQPQISYRPYPLGRGPRQTWPPKSHSRCSNSICLNCPLAKSSQVIPCPAAQTIKTIQTSGKPRHNRARPLGSQPKRWCSVVLSGRAVLLCHLRESGSGPCPGWKPLKDMRK